MLTPRSVSRLLCAALLAAVAACAQPATGSPKTESGVAPSTPFTVAVQQLALSRAEDRSLPTMIWHPIGPGRFPVVLLSHGLGGQPESFDDLARSIAAAGFVVAAPAYPYTKKHSPKFDRNDVRNQPADASFVLDEVAKLDIAGSRMCAAGFSAGGFTTSTMFTATGRNGGLRCGVVISAGAMEGGFTGSPAPILFLHGDADTVVKYSRGRTAYENLNWPKAFLTMIGQGHGEFLDSKRPGFGPASATITDFLRWNLYNDVAARDRLRANGTVPGVSSMVESGFSD